MDEVERAIEDDVNLTIDDYRNAWEASVRIARAIPAEQRAAIEAGFQEAYSRAQAVSDGRLDPLSA